MLKIKSVKSSHPFSSNCYLISSKGEYAVIDPSAAFDENLIKGRLKYILLTHAHFDHILEIDGWKNATDAEVIISAEDARALPDPMVNCFKIYDATDRGYFGACRHISDGETLELGDSKISYISLPGHTIGSGAYLCDNSIFVGDTIFEGGSYGRSDLPTGNSVMLFDSIKRLMSLEDETIVYSGHGSSFSIEEYKCEFYRNFR